MALPSKFYISDLHLGHKNILAFDNRPFFSLEEMTETIISNWNSVVSKNDSVYVLGDMLEQRRNTNSSSEIKWFQIFNQGQS